MRVFRQFHDGVLGSSQSPGPTGYACSGLNRETRSAAREQDPHGHGHPTIVAKTTTQVRRFMLLVSASILCDCRVLWRYSSMAR
jgi:hypothetical protein